MAISMDTDAALAAWTARLADAPAPLELPADWPRPPARSYSAAHARIALDAGLLGRVESLARAEGTTADVVMLAAFGLLLAKYGGGEDVVVGGSAGAETLVLRTDLSGHPTLREVVRRVRDTVIGARALPAVPVDALLAALAPARDGAPLFQAAFALDDGDAGAVDPGRLEAALVAERLELSLACGSDAGGAHAVLAYGTDLFAAETADRILGHFATLLEQVAAAPETRLADADPLGQAERVLVIDGFNRTHYDFPADACLHAVFEARADATPDATAVIFEDAPIAYREIEARANRLARHLRRRGVGPEVRVAICLERGPALVVAMLGVLKAGGAYVPLDPAYPAERLERMLGDSGTAIVLTQSSLRSLFPADADAGFLLVDGDADAIAAESAARPAGGADALNLAYVIYTSGSTGIPKGIAIAHRGVVNNLLDWNRRFGIVPDDRSLLVSSLSFDISVFESLGVLAAGGTVVVPAPAELRDPARWATLMRRHGVTLWNSATALLGMLAEHLDAHPHDAPPTLRLAFVGGDWVPIPLPRRLNAHLPALTTVVMGGVTEVSIYSIIHPVGDVHPAWRSLPYGVPMGNQRAYVLDARLRPLPIGVAGELYLGGVGPARGYAGRPGFTAERFLADPYGVEPGARMYRTGDRARWMADGTLEFLGRLDAQVKIRGNRVEPGEIEAVLRRHPGVARCVVVAREDAPGDRRLAAYVVGTAGAAALREHVRQSLPEYMVPAAFVALDALPLSPNGKVDRRALPAPDCTAAEETYVAPRTAVEEVLAGMWMEVLPVERVGVDDDFFDLGGESVLVMRLIAGLRAQLGIELTFRAVLANPVLGDMAAEVERMLYDDILTLPEEQARELAELNPIAGGWQ
jgi:amino acid adenylation domain-containing protein